MPTSRSKDASTDAFVRTVMSGFLAWLVPGLGHIYLGDRKRGVIFLVTIALTYWTGIAIGGVRGTVHPQQRTAWFLAELCAGGHTLAAYGLHRALPGGLTRPVVHPGRSTPEWPYVGHWRSVEIGIVYAAVAGLLNILIITDAVARADRAPAPSGSSRTPHRARSAAT